MYMFREAQPKPSFATGILDGGWILCLKGLQNWWVAGTPYLEPNSAQPIAITQSEYVAPDASTMMPDDRR